jgi:hypothetical protein
MRVQVVNSGYVGRIGAFYVKGRLYSVLHSDCEHKGTTILQLGSLRPLTVAKI